MKTTLIAAIILGVALVRPAHAFAQTVPDVSRDFGTLTSVLAVGDKVTVVDMNGGTVVGNITNLSASGLSLLVDHRPRQFGADAIRQVERWHQETGKGARVGLMVGVGLGFAMGLMGTSTDEYSSGGLAVFGAAIGGAMGAMCGAVVGASRSGTTVVYRVPLSAPSVKIGPHGGAISFVIRF